MAKPCRPSHMRTCEVASVLRGESLVPRLLGGGGGGGGGGGHLTSQCILLSVLLSASVGVEVVGGSAWQRCSSYVSLI